MNSTKERFAKPIVKLGAGLVFCIGKVCLKIPFTRNKIFSVMMRLSKANTLDDFKDTLFSKQMYNTIVKQTIMDIGKTIKINREIPNYSLIKFVDPTLSREYEEINMLNMQRENVPLVLNFGSCS